MERNDIAGVTDAVLENKGHIHFEYDLACLAKPSGKYDHALARLACIFSTVGYDRISEIPTEEEDGEPGYLQKGLNAVLDGMGFENRELRPEVARDEEAYFFASRKVTLNGRDYDLFVAAFIGSYKKTWFSNFDPLGVGRVCNDGAGYAGNAEAGAIHLGFADAREYSHASLRAFIKKHRTGKPIKLLLTGHSRGAATANLLAAKVLAAGGLGGDIRIEPDDVYTYCFATPNYANTKLVNVRDRRFKRIFNIVSPEDFVTEVFPKACGFGRYGTVYSIFGQDNLSREDYAREKAVMTRFFTDYRSARPYVSYRHGNRAVTKIIAEMAKSMTDMDVFYNKKLRLCFKSCTPYEYFRDTLCTFVGGTDSPEDAAAIARATKLLAASAVDAVGTSPVLRKLSSFFVFKQGLYGVTGGKLSAEYFNDAHISETYLAYMMSMRADQLKRTQ